MCKVLCVSPPLGRAASRLVPTVTSKVTRLSRLTFLAQSLLHAPLSFRLFLSCCTALTACSFLPMLVPSPAASRLLPGARGEAISAEPNVEVEGEKENSPLPKTRTNF